LHPLFFAQFPVYKDINYLKKKLDIF